MPGCFEDLVDRASRETLTPVRLSMHAQFQPAHRMWRGRLAPGRGSVPLPRAGRMPAPQRAGRPHHDWCEIQFRRKA